MCLFMLICVFKVLGSCVFSGEVRVEINIRLAFIENVFRVSSAGSLNTVSHFRELSSGCAGFVLF